MQDCFGKRKKDFGRSWIGQWHLEQANLTDYALYMCSNRGQSEAVLVKTSVFPGFPVLRHLLRRDHEHLPQLEDKKASFWSHRDQSTDLTFLKSTIFHKIWAGIVQFEYLNH